MYNDLLATYIVRGVLLSNNTMGVVEYVVVMATVGLLNNNGMNIFTKGFLFA